MNKTIFLFILALGLYGCASKNTVKEAPAYGKKIKTSKSIPLDTVIKNHAAYDNKDVVVNAKVKKVCAKKGCWMTLQGSNKTFRVKFHDYGFFVPLTLEGKEVLVEGKVIKKTISVKDTRHYLEDAGASSEEIAAVTRPTFEYRIIAKGVRVIQ
jgi:hypothetical protein